MESLNLQACCEYQLYAATLAAVGIIRLISSFFIVKVQSIPLLGRGSTSKRREKGGSGCLLKSVDGDVGNMNASEYIEAFMLRIGW